MRLVFRERLIELTKSQNRFAGARHMVASVVDIAISAPKEHWDVLARDLRFGIRNMNSNRGVTVVTLLTIALGVGATSGISSVAHTVLFQPLPFDEPDDLFMVWMNDVNDASNTDSTSPANFLDWRDQNSVFTDLAAMIPESYNVTDTGQPERVEGFRVSAGFFQILGVQPQRGRTFDVSEDEPGAGQVAVISSGLWLRRWGNDPSALGGTIRLNGIEHNIVGVMPDDFQFPANTDIWVPVAFSAQESASRWDRYVSVVGRLSSGRRRRSRQNRNVRFGFTSRSCPSRCESRHWYHSRFPSRGDCRRCPRIHPYDDGCSCDTFADCMYERRQSHLIQSYDAAH